MSKGTLKKVMGTVAIAIIGISCYSCSENNIPEENGNYTPVRIGNNIQIVSGVIPAPTEATTTVKVIDDSYIVRINNNEVTEVATTAEKTVETIVTTVNDSAMWNQATNTNTAQTYNETGNSPINWKNGYQYYTVQSGDSWSSIAAYLDVDVVQLAAANSCSIYDVLYIGDDLFIPNEYVDYTQQSNNHKPVSSYTQESANTISYTNQMSGTCLSSVTLYSAPDAASWNNIEVSLGQLNGMTLGAGETFNWENQIGWATVSTYYGYQEAPVLVGSDVDYAVGGGVCVTSTALFQAARDAGMAIYERHDHSRGVSYATPGNEASVSYGCLNLIFNNTTGYDVVFYTSCYYGSVTVSCYIA